tara:strand:+ start:9211 stop:10563 length:1353 start_codon:yes stop_codon:yes gene_type:complete
MKKLNEEIQRNRELMGLQEQNSSARKIGFRVCNGSYSSSVHNILVNGNSPQVGDIITITINPFIGGGQIRKVYVTTVQTNNNTNHTLQDVQCETSCTNCQNGNCFNLTTNQPCSACDNDPDCWQDGSNTTTPIPCNSCGCAGVPAITQTYGCTDSNSTNYDPNATCDDGSCIATPDDWFCISNSCQSYPGGAITNWQQYPNITGIYTSQAACDAACGQATSPCTVYGCTDPTALNYNSTILANCDDGSCIPGNTVFGCMDSTASNYDATATIDDGTCTFTNPPCTALTQPIGANWQSNVQTHGWETTFTCLIENANNPCSLLRKKIDDMNAQLQKPFFQNNSTHYNRVTQHIAFAQNLGNNPHNCDNLENLSPGDDTNLTGGSMNWNKPQWESEFTDTVSNHANPCNFLQNRITAWETKLTTISEWSTAWIEMLEFKIEHAESLQSTNNC